jgi:ATP-dependent DNA helicase RecG
MTYSNEDIVLQLQLGEDSWWEFKEIVFSGTRPRSPSRNDLADEIAAFANAEGGVLLCGVTDTGGVQDLSREQLVAIDAFLVEVSTDSIKPAVRIRTQHRQTPDGKRFLVVDIPQGDA